MELKLQIANTENMRQNLVKYQEILEALITSGGLDGVKGGKTILHFDAEGLFMGVQLDYFPWRRKKPIP